MPHINREMKKIRTAEIQIKDLIKIYGLVTKLI